MNIVENNMVVDIDLVIPNDYNPKPDFNSTEELQLEFQKIKDSIAYHGQIDPLVARELNGKYELVNGFHRLQAMKDLGFEKVEIKNLGDITREEAIKKTLSFEELQIPLDRIEVAKLIVALDKDGKSLEGLPYDADVIDSLKKMLDYDWNELNQAVEVSFDEVESKKTIKVEEATYLKFMSEAEAERGLKVNIMRKISVSITAEQAKKLEEIISWGKKEYGLNNKGDVIVKMLQEVIRTWQNEKETV